MRASTTEKAGSMNGVTLPLRANSSQASKTTRIEKMPAPLWKTASSRRAASRATSASAAASEAVSSNRAIAATIA
jgi:hypothetical protein